MRPYTEQQVFELEQASVDIAARLHDPYGTQGWRRWDEDVLEAIIYDALLALREQLIDEEGN